MFSYLTPEMMNLINQQRNKNIPTFEEYFNKKYLEECRVFFENPRFSIKSMMIINHMREVIRNRCIKEYKQKYPWVSIENQKGIKQEVKIEPKNDKFDKDFVIIDDKSKLNDEENQDNKEEIFNKDTNIQLRRSKRLKNKN